MSALLQTTKPRSPFSDQGTVRNFNVVRKRKLVAKGAGGPEANFVVPTIFLFAYAPIAFPKR